MNNPNPYLPFDKFVFRIPTFSLEEDNNKIFFSEIFQEAIYLASPDLYDAIAKEQVDSYEKLPFKLSFSILKYILRAKHRCTPFGLFAGCGLGSISQSTSMVGIDGFTTWKSNTRLDMMYLQSLCNSFTSMDELKFGLTYVPNDSIYKIEGVGYRCIEHKYVNSARKYFLSEVDLNEALEEVFLFCKSGALGEEVVASLIDEDVTEEEAREFFISIVEAQLLIPVVNCPVTGDNDTVDEVIEWGKSFNPILDDQTSTLEVIKNKLRLLDSLPIGRDLSKYEDMVIDIKKNNVNYNRKHLFQSDLAIHPAQACINQGLVDQISEGLNLLNKITPNREDSILKKFKADFYSRYESEEIPLLEALDVDAGICLSNISGDIAIMNSFIDDVRIAVPNESVEKNEVNVYSDFVLKKYHEFLEKGGLELEITDDDIKNLPMDWTDISDTVYAIVELIEIDKDENSLVVIKSVGGASAASMLARFAHSHSGIKSLVNDITRVEEQLLKSNQILAEIVHLSQLRTGNITYRPNLRKFQIPYLTLNTAKDVHSIPISDIMVSMPERNTMVLRSKSLNKEIIPKQTTAHNFSNDSLPIYHFLCLFQMEKKRKSLYFSWGGLKSNVFLPRVRYKGLILSLAKWTIPYDSFKDISNADEVTFEVKSKRFQEKYNIPDQVYFIQGDNKLVINFSDLRAVRLLFSEAKSRTMLLEEFPYSGENMFVTGDNGAKSYTNEVVLGFYKNN